MGISKDLRDLTGIDNQDLWLSQKEVTDIENITERTFWRAIQDYRYTYRYVGSKSGGRGGKRIEIALSSLSPQGQKNYFERMYIKEPITRELLEKFQLQVPPDKIGDPRTAGMVRMVCECMAISAGSHGRRERIAEIAAGYGFHVGSAYRLLDRVRKGKPLIGKRKPSGERFEDLGITLRAWDRRAAEIAIGMIMENRRRHVDGLTLYQHVKDTAKAERLKTGSYDSFMAIKKKLDESPAGTRRDKGRQGLRQDVMPPIRRDPTAYRPMECLIGDQHKADYYAFDSSGRVITLELFCWMDFRTQLVWSAIAYKHYNRYTVGQALINAVRWGLPGTVYTDWGKPEESNYMTLLIKQLTGLGITTESIEHVKATGRHPQAKPIEGFYGNLDRLFKNAQIPGYCKRLKDSRENEVQQKELNALIKAQGLLQIEELVERVIGQVQEWNEHAFKNRGEDNGKSPLEIYREEIKQYPVTTLSEDVLDYIFLPVRHLTIKNTTVRFKHEWLGIKVYYDRALAEHNGCKAEVRYDPFDPWRAWVFVDGALVCEAEEWEMINPKIPDQVAEKMAEQKALARQIQDIYCKYLPPRPPVRRINPAERKARQLRGQTTDDRGRTTDTIRVMETSLERRGQTAEGRGQMIDDRRQRPDPLAEFRKRFHPGARKPDDSEEEKHKPLFKLSMKQLRGD